MRQETPGVWLLPLLLLAGSATAQSLEELPVPHPDLSSLQPTLTRKIETLQTDLAARLEDGSATDDELPFLIEGFGLLGQLLHAFDLLDAALVSYRNAETLAPSDLRWPYYRGLIHHQRGRLDEAVAAYSRVLELQPDQLSTLLRLGNALLELGREEEAGRRFERVLELEPDTPAALYGRGTLAAGAGDHRAAVHWFERVLELDPEATVVHYPLAQSLRRLGDEERAAFHLARRGEREVVFRDDLAAKLRVIEKSLALEVVADLAAEEDFSEPDFLGYVLSQLGGAPGAADQLRKLLENLAASGSTEDRQSGRVRYAAGALLVAEGRDEEAVAELRAAVELDPGLGDARLKLGNGLARLGRYEEAVEVYGRLLERRNGDHREALAQRAAALSNLGRLEEARADLERVVQQAPNDRQTRLDLAKLLELMGEGETAAEHRAAAVELSKSAEERAAARVSLAGLYRRLGDPQSAGVEYERALLEVEDHRPALHGLASLLAQLGRLPQAAYVYGRLVELDPQDVEARVGEATALILTGEHDEARRRLEKGLDLLPESLDLKDLLSRHLAACPDRSVRDGERALEIALELYEAVPSPETVETVAMAYAEAGRFEEAVAWQKRLLSEGSEREESELERWRANLALYEQGEACCAAEGS